MRHLYDIVLFCGMLMLLFYPGGDAYNRATPSVVLHKSGLGGLVSSELTRRVKVEISARNKTREGPYAKKSLGAAKSLSALAIEINKKTSALISSIYRHINSQSSSNKTQSLINFNANGTQSSTNDSSLGKGEGSIGSPARTEPSTAASKNISHLEHMAQELRKQMQSLAHGYAISSRRPTKVDTTPVDGSSRGPVGIVSKPADGKKTQFEDNTAADGKKTQFEDTTAADGKKTQFKDTTGAGPDVSPSASQKAGRPNQKKNPLIKLFKMHMNSKKKKNNKSSNYQSRKGLASLSKNMKDAKHQSNFEEARKFDPEHLISEEDSSKSFEGLQPMSATVLKEAPTFPLLSGTSGPDRREHYKLVRKLKSKAPSKKQAHHDALHGQSKKAKKLPMQQLVNGVFLDPEMSLNTDANLIKKIGIWQNRGPAKIRSSNATSNFSSSTRNGASGQSNLTGNSLLTEANQTNVRSENGLPLNLPDLGLPLADAKIVSSSASSKAEAVQESEILSVTRKLAEETRRIASSLQAMSENQRQFSKPQPTLENLQTQGQNNSLLCSRSGCLQGGANFTGSSMQNSSALGTMAELPAIQAYIPASVSMLKSAPFDNANKSYSATTSATVGEKTRTKRDVEFTKEFVEMQALPSYEKENFFKPGQEDFLSAEEHEESVDPDARTAFEPHFHVQESPLYSSYAPQTEYVDVRHEPHLHRHHLRHDPRYHHHNYHEGPHYAHKQHGFHDNREDHYHQELNYSQNENHLQHDMTNAHDEEEHSTGGSERESYHNHKFHHVKVKLHGPGKTPEEWERQHQQELDDMTHVRTVEDEVPDNYKTEAAFFQVHSHHDPPQEYKEHVFEENEDEPKGERLHRRMSKNHHHYHHKNRGLELDHHQDDEMLKDEEKSRSNQDPLYPEDNYHGAEKSDERVSPPVDNMLENSAQNLVGSFREFPGEIGDDAIGKHVTNGDDIKSAWDLGLVDDLKKDFNDITRDEVDSIRSEFGANIREHGKTASTDSAAVGELESRSLAKHAVLHDRPKSAFGHGQNIAKFHRSPVKGRHVVQKSAQLMRPLVKTFELPIKQGRRKSRKRDTLPSNQLDSYVDPDDTTPPSAWRAALTKEEIVKSSTVGLNELKMLRKHNLRDRVTTADGSIHESLYQAVRRQKVHPEHAAHVYTIFSSDSMGIASQFNDSAESPEKKFIIRRFLNPKYSRGPYRVFERRSAGTETT